MKGSKIKKEGDVEMEEGSMESIDFMDQEVQKRFISCNIKIKDEELFEYLADGEDKKLDLESLEDVDSSPIADQVFAFVSGVIFSGRLGKQKNEQSN